MPTPFDRLRTGFDTPAVRATQGERPFTKLVTTPFVLSALRSKAYRSMSGVTTEVSRFNFRNEMKKEMGNDDVCKKHFEPL